MPLRSQRAYGLAERKVDNATATGATTVVTANPGCFIQLQTGLRRRGSAMRVRHLVDLLDESYHRADEEAMRSEPVASPGEPVDAVR